LLKGIYPFWPNIYQTLPFFAILGALSPHFQSHSGKIWHEGAILGDPPHAKFGKNPLKGRTPLGQIVTKKPILGVVSPHFKNQNGQIWR